MEEGNEMRRETERRKEGQGYQGSRRRDAREGQTKEVWTKGEKEGQKRRGMMKMEKSTETRERRLRQQKEKRSKQEISMHPSRPSSSSHLLLSSPAFFSFQCPTLDPSFTDETWSFLSYFCQKSMTFCRHTQTGESDMSFTLQISVEYDPALLLGL